MNELIHLKKHRNYHLIPKTADKTDNKTIDKTDNKTTDKTNEIVIDIVNTMVDCVVDDIVSPKQNKTNNCNTNNYQTDIVPSISRSYVVKNNSEEKECRICFEEETSENPFIWPCKCKGTSKYVHESCLNQWRQENMDNPAYEICMECRYRYKYKYKYPIETDSMVPINGFFVFVLVHISPILISYLMTQIDITNDMVIIKHILGHDSDIIKFMNGYTATYQSISYCIYYSTVLFFQSMLFSLFYIVFICQTVHSKKLFFKQLVHQVWLYIWFLIKFPVLLSTMNSVAFMSVLITGCTICIVIEALGYVYILKTHNDILLNMNIENISILMNYEEHDDTNLNRDDLLSLNVYELYDY